jgi:hypothetical protein
MVAVSTTATAALSMGDAYGTWAEAYSNVNGGYIIDRDYDDHNARTGIYFPAIAYTYMNANLYSLAGEAIAFGGNHGRSGHAAGNAFFWDTYTVTADPGVPSVQVGMSIHLNVPESSANFFIDVWNDSNNNIAVNEGDAHLYFVQGDDGSYSSSVGGNPVVPADGDIKYYYGTHPGYTGGDYAFLTDLSSYDATIYFSAEPGSFRLDYQIGVSAYSYGDYSVGGERLSAEIELFSADPNIIDFTSESGQGISAVPIPGSVLLFGSGLAGLAGLTRKKKKANFLSI